MLHGNMVHGDMIVNVAPLNKDKVVIHSDARWEHNSR
jgi:hypothetical protein